jgi:spore coat polysaccharide biosynthesis protein SpsF
MELCHRFEPFAFQDERFVNSILAGSMKIRGSILIRCDGYAEIGLGHVVRCLALADELRDTFHCDTHFAMRKGEVGMKMVQARGYRLCDPESIPFDYASWMKAALQHSRAEILVLDNRDEMPRSLVGQIRDSGVSIAAIDDPSDRRLEADLAFYPPVPQVNRMSWEGFKGEVFRGWEWIPLRRQFMDPPPRRRNERPVVLVAMGGSDPVGLTLKAVRALDLLHEEFETVVVLGPAFCHQDAFDGILKQAHRPMEIRRGVSEMAELMAQADLAVASFGVTAFELATVGVPGIYLCMTEDHAESASTFAESGMGVVLGLHSQVDERNLADSFSRLLADSGRRREMSHQCRKLADGRGTERIARILAERLKTSHVEN